jgi:hypothetical protein
MSGGWSTGTCAREREARPVAGGWSGFPKPNPIWFADPKKQAENRTSGLSNSTVLPDFFSEVGTGSRSFFEPVGSGTGPVPTGSGKPGGGVVWHP